MKTILLRCFFILSCWAAYSSSFAQYVSITGNGGTSGNIIVGQSNYHASESIFLESEIGAGNFESAPTSINAIAFNVDAATSATLTFPIAVTNFAVYMKNIPAGTTTLATGTYDLTGYTQVFSGTFNITNYGWNNITLTTSFVRTSGTNLEVLIVRSSGTVTAGISFNAAAGSGADGNALSSRRYNGTTAPAANSTSLTATNFRPAIQLKHAFANDIGIDNIYPLGTNGKGLQNVVRAFISNYGTTTRTNLPVTLSVTGSNTFTTTVTIASLPAGAAGFLTFPQYTCSNIGTNTVTVSVPSDDFTANNAQTVSQDISVNQINYNIGTTPDGSVNGGMGSEIAAKFAVPYPNNLSKVDIYFGVAGNTYDINIYNNVGGAPGTVIGSLTGQTTAVGLNSITFPSPIAISDSFWVSLKQTGAALNTAFQTETPLRQNAFFLKSGTNPWFDLAGNSANTFRFMIGVTTSLALPVTLTNFSGRLEGNDAALTWTTATEINNSGFEVEKSLDGSNFKTIGFVAGAGNSTSVLHYQFFDPKIPAGTNYYRLKQIDKDGRSVTSSVVQLKRALTNGFEVTMINPSKGKVSMQINSDNAEQVSLSLYTMNGQLISSKNAAIGTGNNAITIGDNLLRGSYIVNILKKGEASSYKVIVE